MHFHKYRDIYVPTRMAKNTGVMGEFRCELRENGILVEERPWKRNLVTDAGLLNMTATNGWSGNMCIGSGSSTPQASDVSLDTLLAANSNSESGLIEENGGAPNYEAISTLKYRFNAGNGTGTVSEFGIGTNGNLSVRALLDTPIVKGANQVLDIFWRFTAFPDLTDTTGQVVIAGETYDFTCRAQNVDNMVYTMGNWVYGNWSYVSSETVQAVTDTMSVDASGIPANLASTKSQGQYDIELFYGLDQGNIAGDVGIRGSAIDFGLNRSSQSYEGLQCDFANVVGGTTIPKDNTKTIQFDWRWTWSRLP